MYDILSLQTTLLKVVQSLHTALYQGTPQLRGCVGNTDHIPLTEGKSWDKTVCLDVGTPFPHFHKALL